MTNPSALRRRDVLAALGLGAGSLFLPSLGRAAGEPPKRFVLMLTAQGCAPDRWRCNPAGLPTDVDWAEDWTQWAEEDFSQSLAPLRPWAANCTAVGGLGLVSCAADGSGFHHERAVAHGATGARAEWRQGIPYTGAATLDQLLARALARPDRYPSLECSVDGGLEYEDVGSAIYRGRGQPLPAIDDPAVLFDRLFSAQVDGVDPLLLQQASALDRVAERYALQARRLSQDDRQKLSAHRDLVRDLERRLVGTLTASCDTVPALDGGARTPDADFENHARLLAAAFSCDLTRVASLQFNQLDPTVLGLPAGDMHDRFAHGIWYDEAAADAMGRYMAHHAAQLARFLEILDSVPEGNGTLLDNTVVLWITELADSWHGMDGFPAVVAGGANSGLRLGRYLHHANTTPFETVKPVPDAFMGLPHNRLLVTVAQAMGLSVDTVGVASIEGWDGSLIDCTGPLAELLA